MSETEVKEVEQNISKARLASGSSEEYDYDEEYDDDIDEVTDGPYVFFKDREEWKDVEPVEQDDGPYSAVKIDYTPKFKDVYDYLRAVIKSGEKSRRVLTLTAHAIIFNAANYTAWQYRRDVVKELDMPQKMSGGTLTPSFENEMSFSRKMIEGNSKNYQVWHHRKILVSWAAGYNEETGQLELESQDDASLLLNKELELTSLLINRDAKNYHAWQHRQWVISIFNGFDDELQYTASLIEIDVRNNSAWNQRFFVIKNWSKVDQALIAKEVEYTIGQIWKAVSNESPWSYLRALLLIQGKLGEETPFFERCKNQTIAESPSVPLHVFVLDNYEERMDNGNITEEMFIHARQICDHLAEKLDPVRKGYWALVKKRFTASEG